MKEADVQRWVQDKLKSFFGDRLYIFKVPQGPYSSRRGIPDLIMSIDGKFAAIEVKMPAGQLTALQTHELNEIGSKGCQTLVIYGKDKVAIDEFCSRY